MNTKGKKPGPTRVLTKVGEVDWKGVGLPGLPPGFGSSWGDWLQRCEDLVWFRREGWLRRGHGCVCQGGGPACSESGCNAWLDDGGCLAGFGSC